MGEGSYFLGESGFLFNHKEDKVEQPPAEEGPVGTMPGTSERPDNEKIQNMPRGRNPVSAQRNIHIVPEPAAEGHVPATPEFCGTFRNVGIIEVFRKMESEHEAKADGHIGISGEIEINLQSVGNGSQPGGGHGSRCTVIEYVVGHLCHIIGNQYFLGKPINKAEHAIRKQIPGFRPCPDFIHNRGIADNRPGYQLGKKSDIQGNIKKILLYRNFLVVHIENIGEYLEGEKGNAKGQRNLQVNQRGVEKQA